MGICRRKQGEHSDPMEGSHVFQNASYRKLGAAVNFTRAVIRSCQSVQAYGSSSLGVQKERRHKCQGPFTNVLKGAMLVTGSALALRGTTEQRAAMAC